MPFIHRSWISKYFLYTFSKCTLFEIRLSVWFLWFLKYVPIVNFLYCTKTVKPAFISCLILVVTFVRLSTVYAASIAWLVIECRQRLYCVSTAGSVMAHRWSPHHVIYWCTYVEHLCRSCGRQQCSSTSWQMLLLLQFSRQVWCAHLFTGDAIIVTILGNVTTPSAAV